MKRIVFSIYTSDIDKNHTSTTSFKRSQFEKYKDHDHSDCRDINGHNCFVTIIKNS